MIKIIQDAQCAVIGHGSWATAIVKILLDNGNIVNWYVRNADVMDHLAKNHTNPKYLSNVHFYTDHLTIHNDINAAIEPSGVVILATPSAFLQGVMDNLTVSLSSRFIISAIKGIVPNGYLTVAEYIHHQYYIPFSQIGILTGPCHAEEVALERLSYLTMVCKDEDVSKLLSTRFANSYIKMNSSNDIYGTEYASVLKNIYAIAVGMCHALGYGDNFLAVLISNAALEMERFMDTTYPAKRNVCHSAYLGDLLVTCYSQFSRNRTFGIMIGKGYSVKNAQIEMNMVAEGYYSTACIQYVKKRCGVDISLPICEAMYAVLYEHKNPKNQINNLLDKLI
ncbi:MAG: NAD(P)H-dependent glycerol-3-phosphate dehydrogenase [Mucinivorans sp.]